MYPQSPSKWQLSEQERRGEITPAEYYRALQERSDALNFAAKRKPGGKKKESGEKKDPTCNTGNYQCRGSKGVACIPKSKGCRSSLKNVDPLRKQYINDTIEKLKEAGKSPPKVRIGRKLGAPITDISWEQYAKALELNVSGRKLSVGDATREQLKAIGVDVDGLMAKPTQPERGNVPPGPQTKLQKAQAEKDARAPKLTDTPSGRFYTVDAVAVQTDAKPDPAIVDLLERSNGVLLRPPVLTETGLEEFTPVTNPEIAAAAKAAYDRTRKGSLEMFPAIVTKDPAAAQRQAALLADDTGVEIPSGYINPKSGLSADKRDDFDSASARFSTMDLALIRDPNAANRNFDPAEIDALAREMLASGGTIAPIPLTMTKPIGQGLDGDGEYAPVAGFKALAAANRARELDPKFEMVGSNFVDLDNPAEVEQLRRFYGGEAVGNARPVATKTAKDLRNEIRDAESILEYPKRGITKEGKQFVANDGTAFARQKDALAYATEQAKEKIQATKRQLFESYSSMIEGGGIELLPGSGMQGSAVWRQSVRLPDGTVEEWQDDRTYRPTMDGKKMPNFWVQAAGDWFNLKPQGDITPD